MKCVAVVDDASEFLRLVQDLLADEGYETVLWAGSHGVHEMLLREQPALVLLDIRMEHEDSGVRILETMRRDPHTAALPVIVCTADLAFLRAHGERLRALHCELLPKPFALDVLLENVTRLIGPPIG